MLQVRYFSQLPQVFSSKVIKDLAKSGKSNLLSDIIKETGFNNLTSLEEMKYGDVFENIYDLLVDEYRCEYVYKNTIANKILKNRHSLTRSTILSEFRVNKSKADIVILNGSSSVYEIKTELDNLDRLNNQLEDYKKIFNKIFVVTYPSNVEKVKNIVENKVGILTVTENLKIESVREAKENKKNIKQDIIFDSLRRSEYTEIIREFYGYVPEVPNTQIYSECKKLFLKIPKEVAHDKMVDVLRNRSYKINFGNLLFEIPTSLRMAFLSSNLTLKERRNLPLVLNSIIL